MFPIAVYKHPQRIMYLIKKRFKIGSGRGETVQTLTIEPVLLFKGQRKRGKQVVIDFLKGRLRMEHK